MFVYLCFVLCLCRTGFVHRLEKGFKMCILLMTDYDCQVTFCG